MNGLQVFAFIGLPILVAAIGWVASFLVVGSARSGGGDQSAPPSEPLRRRI